MFYSLRSGENTKLPEEIRGKTIHFGKKIRGKRSFLGKSQGEVFWEVCINPEAVTAKTIARWVVLFLQECGVDTNIFKAHSVRAASTSKALKLGIPLGDIGKAEG